MQTALIIGFTALLATAITLLAASKIFFKPVTLNECLKAAMAEPLQVWIQFGGGGARYELGNRLIRIVYTCVMDEDQRVESIRVDVNSKRGFLGFTFLNSIGKEWWYKHAGDGKSNVLTNHRQASAFQILSEARKAAASFDKVGEW